MKALTGFTLKELEFLKEVVESKELQDELNLLLEERRNQTISVDQYQSSRLPEYYEQYKDQCSVLLSQFTIQDVPFLYYCSYMDAGNNRGGWFNRREQKVCHIVEENVGYLESFFDGNDQNISLYEGTYNTLNYLRASICTSLKREPGIECKNDLIKDQDEKREIVTEALRPIAEELSILRGSIPNSRLSIANQGLTRTAKKTSTSLTFYQKLFIDAIAFGSNIEDLKEGNYEAAKRLLFVPQPRMQQKESK